MELHSQQEDAEKLLYYNMLRVAPSVANNHHSLTYFTLTVPSAVLVMIKGERKSALQRRLRPTTHLGIMPDVTRASESSVNSS